MHIRSGYLIASLAATAWLAGCGAPRGTVQDLPVRSRPAPPADEPAPAPLPPTAEDEPVGVIHIVERGQTLWRIARSYGVDVQRLAQINRIEDPSRLEVGEPLWIPDAAEPLTVAVAPPADLALGAGDWVWPVEGGAVVSHFGASRGGRSHRGIDIRGRHGQPVIAASDGTVVYSGGTMRGYGKTVILDHGDGVQTLYAHNADLLVHHGDRVERGQTIARVGKTGNASAEHCHFEVRQSQRAIDPMTVFGPLIGARP